MLNGTVRAELRVLRVGIPRSVLRPACCVLNSPVRVEATVLRVEWCRSVSRNPVQEYALKNMFSIEICLKKMFLCKICFI